MSGELLSGRKLLGDFLLFFLFRKTGRFLGVLTPDFGVILQFLLNDRISVPTILVEEQAKSLSVRTRRSLAVDYI